MCAVRDGFFESQFEGCHPAGRVHGNILKSKMEESPELSRPAFVAP